MEDRNLENGENQEETQHSNNDAEQGAVEQEEEQEQHQGHQQEEASGQSSNNESVEDLRKAKEKAEQERSEAIAYAYQLYSQNQQPAQNVNNNTQEDDLNDDDLLDYKTYKRLAQQKERELQQREQKINEQLVENKLSSKYKDFNEVVTTENLRKLSKEHPEIAESLDSMNSLYSKGSMAYKMINTFVAPKAAPNIPQNRKPRSSASLSGNQGSESLSNSGKFGNKLTKEQERALLEEMRRSKNKM